MTDTKHHGGPAFPCETVERTGMHSSSRVLHGGMTMRDYLAGQALAGILAGYWGNPEMSGLSQRDIADEAYVIADAMMEASK